MLIKNDVLVTVLLFFESSEFQSCTNDNFFVCVLYKVLANYYFSF